MKLISSAKKFIPQNRVPKDVNISSPKSISAMLK